MEKTEGYKEGYADAKAELDDGEEIWPYECPDYEYAKGWNKAIVASLKICTNPSPRECPECIAFHTRMSALDESGDTGHGTRLKVIREINKRCEEKGCEWFKEVE